MSDSAQKVSPLLGEHEALGANLTEFGGWQMPLRYASDTAEHHAVRKAAGLFDISHMGEFEITGPDAGKFLDYALVGDLTALNTGRARYTMICAEDGSVIDDLIVYHPEPGAYLVVANAGNSDVVGQEFERRSSGFDVTITDQTADTALIAIQGPRALEILLQTPGIAVLDGPDALKNLPYYASVDGSFDDHHLLIARTGYTGEDGFELFVHHEYAVALWRALLAAGTGKGLIPAGLSARDSLRLEAGMPLYGHELDLTTTPYEAGLGRVVKLTKTSDDGTPLPFVGRAALDARRHSQPARVLVGLRSHGRRAVRAGDKLVIDASDLSKEIGFVTSGAPSPTLGYPIAMAYVSPEFSAVGTSLTAVVRGRPEMVDVVSLPFYSRP